MQVILNYFKNLSPGQISRFSQLEELYRYWNSQINVISRKDLDNLWIHHVLHSLSIGIVVPFLPGTQVTDAGTGGGFPGIPLAILFPGVQFTLVDSIGKKTKVALEIARSLQLDNCSVIHSRMEDLRLRTDFVVSRAVADLQQLVEWTGHMIIPGGMHGLSNGLIALKGGNLTAELETVKQVTRVYPLNRLFSEPYFETKQLVHVAVHG